VLSFLFLGAKCRGCRAPISWRYPGVELLTGALFAGATWLLLRDGLGGAERWIHIAAAFAFLASLVALTFIDIDHRILPDRLTKPGMAVGALFSVLLPELQGTGRIPSLPPAGEALLLSLAGMAAGYGSLWLIAWVGEKAFRREAMGLGDAKLLAMVGAFTGPKGVLLAGVVGLLLGLVVGLLQKARTGDPTFPFGPSLAAGGAVAFLAPGALPRIAEGIAVATGDPRLGLGMMVLFALLLHSVRRGFPRSIYFAFMALVLLLAGVYGVIIVSGTAR
jgi:leader peptidase (prepilin peptidase)/N-methyltransferase